ncbi:MAG: hypothetical protein ACTHMY_19760 [Solirubrobacteraceae bacterium]
MRRLAMMCAACLLMTVSVSWAAGLRHGPAQVQHISAHKQGAAQLASAQVAKPALSRFILLGNPAVGSTRSATHSGAARAFAFRARRSGTAYSISLYLARASTARTVSAGLYRDNGGKPGSQIVHALIVRPRAGVWNTTSLSTVGLTAGRMYWVAILGRGGRVVLAAANRSACGNSASRRARLSRLPASFGGRASSGPCSVSAFISGKPGSAGPGLAGSAPLGGSGSTGPTNGTKQPVAGSASGAAGLLGGALLPPINIGAPTITGTAAWGQTLTISSKGSWVGSPTAYSYQWQDCGTLPIACTDSAGATGTSYVVGARDVGSTIRAVVTASNSAGASSGASSTTGTVATPSAPTAAFSFSPAAPQTNQAVAFDGSASSCAATPCSYSWADDPPSGGSWSLGSGQRISFAFSSAGTKYATLTVTDGMNRTASVEHNVAVTNPTPPSPPSNSSPPTISGTAQQGQTLIASPGTWSGSPSYSYQWEDCNALGASCGGIAGATASSYRVASTDVGDTIRVAVTASNGGGSASATSSQTSVVTASTGGGSQSLNCFGAPGACGYPDPSYGNVGVANCAALPTWSPSDLPSGSYYYSGSGNVIDLEASNVTIKGYNIGNWQFWGDVSNFTLDGDCLSFNGGGSNGAVAVMTKGSGETIENSTIVSPGCTASALTICTSTGVTQALVSGGPSTTIKNNILAGAVEPINSLGAGSVIQNNYIVSNGYESGGHAEDIYESQVAGLTIDHNTLLNPFDQTSTIFGDTLGQACQNQFTITNNLMAGGGYILYSCASASGPGTSSLVFSGNDIARCGGTSTYDPSLGGHYCGSTGPSATGSSVGAGADSHGYWPGGGFFGLASGTYCSGGGGVTWSGNFWDDNGAAVGCPA